MPAHPVDDSDGDRTFIFSADAPLAEAIAEIACELSIRPGELVRRVVGQVFLSRPLIYPTTGEA